MARVDYREGTWFAVPLRDGGFGVGVVARANVGGVLLGYFFGPKHAEVPELSNLAGLRTDDAALIAMFGLLGLKRGDWPVLGRLAGWDRREWPIPVFVRHEELSGRSFQVFYDDDDANKVIREVQVPPSEAGQGPKDGLMGAGFTEKVLTTLLG